MVEREGAALELVLEPAGGCNDDVRARRGLGLLQQADTAVHGGDLQGPGVRDRTNLLDDLGCQLTRRRQHQHGRAAGLGGGAIDERDPEGERLARARGGAGQHVTTGQNIADHLTAGSRTVP